MPNFFPPNISLQWYQQKNKEKTYGKLIHLHIKTRLPITWLSDIMRKTLKYTQGCKFHITFVINVIIILVGAHRNYKSLHHVTIIAQKTWENFSFELQKLRTGEKNVHNYSM